MVELRAPVERLRMNGISGIAVQRIDDPAVIPLWFGEGDLPTPAFICDAAKHAMDTGGTFYTHPRGGLPIRNALKDYLDALYRNGYQPGPNYGTWVDHAGHHPSLPSDVQRR